MEQVLLVEVLKLLLNQINIGETLYLLQIQLLSYLGYLG